MTPPPPIAITAPPDGAAPATPVFVSQGDVHIGARLLPGMRVQTWAYYRGILVHNTIAALGAPIPGGTAINYDYRWANMAVSQSIQWVLWLDEVGVPHYRIWISAGTTGAGDPQWVSNDGNPIEGILP